MKAIQIERPNQIRIVNLPEPQPGAGEILIRVMASGICGTDIHIFRGEYLGGYPIIPGHEFSGVVEKVDTTVTRFKPGDRVAVEPNIACDNCSNCLNNRHNFCLNWQAVGVTRPGGMAEYLLAPEKAVFSIGDLPFDLGAFVEPLSCVLHGIERARLRMGDRVVILGAGPIGLLLMQAARLQGSAQVTCVERQTGRREIAQACGANHVLENLDELEKDCFDMVIDATGNLVVMSHALEYARPGGTVLLFGVPPSGKKMEIEAFQVFRKGLTLLSSFTSVRNSYQAVTLLQSGQINPAPLISHRFSLEQFERGIELIEQGKDRVMKVLILPNGEIY
jgi:D-arabinitol dehydrogenase (NADP+)